ncbi:hypothetical protein [Cyanobacterium sp. Dongsha4]|uniref:hypothetical protein n=1 Tax=Cyanobacterium sp. DS4 TaxID=2878255 RepID=UPI002E7FE674|nr:hypothetical protein [Cyanobacterium sp. Dongsha4]WVL00215.1 hypothetical protein Dongsha4_16415 [Cyanobacterium sp. Dongsha4]
MRKTINLLIILYAILGIKILPSIAATHHSFKVNTRGLATVPIKHIPDNSGVTIYKIKNNQTVLSSFQSDYPTMYYDSKGNIWWEIYYESNGTTVEGYIEDKYLLGSDGTMSCVNNQRPSSQTPSACSGD